MKTKMLALLTAVALAASLRGQGILLDNLGNWGGVGATSGGMVYVGFPLANGIGLFDGLHYNLGVEVWGGPSPGSLSPMGTFTVNTDPKGYTGMDMGWFQLGAPGIAVNVPGVAPGGTAYVQLNIWYDGTGGLYPNWWAAMNGGVCNSVLFANPTYNPFGQPPMPPPNLVGMPSIFLVWIPEPSTLSLLGLGALGLMLFRGKLKQIRQGK